MVFNFHGSIELTEEQINDIVNRCIDCPEYKIEYHIWYRLSCCVDIEYSYDYCQMAIPFIKPEIEKRLRELHKIP